jgi:Fe-S cluster biosynthesis and repair protein YggX
MSSIQERIAQYRKMANDDPENELGHYRLGKELMDDGQCEEAVKSLRRTIELSPQFSKAYQLLGASLSKLGRREDAAQVLREGFAIADERGDNLPRDEIARLLVDLGEAPPASKKAARAPAGGPGDGFRCQRPGCLAGTRARRLPRPPMSDEMGKRIYENICADCWDYWLRNLSIKVINEMRLDLSTERGQEVYDQIMRETLGFE